MKNLAELKNIWNSTDAPQEHDVLWLEFLNPDSNSPWNKNASRLDVIKYKTWFKEMYTKDVDFFNKGRYISVTAEVLSHFILVFGRTCVKVHTVEPGITTVEKMIRINHHYE